MSKAVDKRLVLFEKYKGNLNFLIENGFITGQKDVYLCPICLTPHHGIDGADPLSLEDAPPRSLGGTANTLTCKSCNNTAGHKIDFHLTERLKELDSAKLVPGTKTAVKVDIKGETFQGELTVEPDGTLKMFHSNKNNNALKLAKSIADLKGGMTVDMKYLKSRVKPDNLEYALLKTAYLLSFERFGYSLLLEPCFETVRQQLQTPEERIYPQGFWFRPPFSKSMEGVFFVTDPGLECILVLFTLNTGLTQTMFGVHLPLPLTPIEESIENRIKKFSSEGGQIVLTLEPVSKIDFLNDVEELQKLYSWVQK